MRAPGAHAILLLDQAGWHGAKALKVPRNISLFALAAAATRARTQWSRKYLAIHVAELAVEPNFRIFRRHRRSLIGRRERYQDHLAIGGSDRAGPMLAHLQH